MKPPAPAAGPATAADRASVTATLSRFWATFTDSATEDAYLESLVCTRDGARATATIVRLSLAMALVYVAFITLFSVDPTDFQVMLSVARAVLFGILCIPTLWGGRWQRLVLDHTSAMRAGLAAAYLVAVGTQVAIEYDESRANRTTFEGETLTCENQITLVYTAFYALMWGQVCFLVPILTAGHVAIVAAGLFLGISSFVLLSSGDGGFTVVVSGAFLFLTILFATIARKARIDDRFTFMAVSRLEENNVSVRLMFSPFRAARVNPDNDDAYRPPWLVDESELELGAVIGRGGYGEVFRAQWRGTTVAVKRNLAASKAEQDGFEAEAALMMDLRHPRLVLWMGVSVQESDKALLMILEYCDLGSLADLIHSKTPRVDLTQPKRIELMTQAAVGMRFLHANHPPVLHRDFKTANVLVDANMTAKVADFGLAQRGSSGGDSDEDEVPPLGTLLYTSPEVMLGRAFEKPADVYSFSIVFWEVLASQIPFSSLIKRLNGSTVPYIVQSIVELQLRPPIEDLDDETPPSVVELIKTGWESSPDARPTFDEIVDKLQAFLDTTTTVIETVTQSSFSSIVANNKSVSVVVRCPAACEMLVEGSRTVSRDGLELLSEVVLERLRALHSLLDDADGATFSARAPDTALALRLAVDLVRALSEVPWPADAADLSTCIVAVGEPPDFGRMVGPEESIIIVDAATHESVKDTVGDDVSPAPDHPMSFHVKDLTPPTILPPPETTYPAVISIPPQDLVFEDARRSSTLGSVYDGLMRDEPVTIRRISTRPSAKQQVVLDVLKDIADITRLRHKNVVATIGMCSALEAAVCVVTEPVPHTLREVISVTTPLQRFGLVGQAALGVAYLHSQDFVHQSITTVAISVAADLASAKIDQIGLRRVSVQTATMTATGSPIFLAPELIDGEPCAASSDVYALGMVLVEAATGLPPHKGKRWADIIADTRRGLRPALPSNLPRAAKALIRAALDKSPSLRPSAEAVAEDLSTGNVLARV